MSVYPKPICGGILARGGDEAGWRCFDDAVEQREIAGDATRVGSQSGSVVVVEDEEDILDFGTEGIGGGATHVCPPNLVRGTEWRC